MQLTDKVNTMTLDQRQKLVGLEIAKARQDTAIVAEKLDTTCGQLDVARAQLLEMTRQWREVQVTLGVKSDKAALAERDEQLDSLCASFASLEERQDASERKVGFLQEQLYYARYPSGGGSIPAAGDHLCGSGDTFQPKRPPPSPREHRANPRRANMPGNDSPYKFKPKFACG